MDGLADGPVDECTDERMNEWTDDEQTCGRTDGPVDGQTCGKTDGAAGETSDLSKDSWMD